MLLEQIQHFDIPVAKTFDSFDSLEDLISYTRALEDAEGFVVAFDDGHRIKIKADQYVRIHKCLDRIRFDRNIAALILNEELDDLTPLLPDHELQRIKKFAQNFNDCLHDQVKKYEILWDTVCAKGMDRKEYAQTWKEQFDKTDPFASSYVFGRFSNKNGREMIIDYIKRHTSTNVKWSGCSKWMGL